MFIVISSLLYLGILQYIPCITSPSSVSNPYAINSLFVLYRFPCLNLLSVINLFLTFSIMANGNDLIYVSKNAVNVNDSDDEPHTDVPSDCLQVENDDNLQIDKTK